MALYKILSIDGGGIRSIIPAVLLTEMEKRTGKDVYSLFDLIAGTSTGGIPGRRTRRAQKPRP